MRPSDNCNIALAEPEGISRKEFSVVTDPFFIYKNNENDTNNKREAAYKEYCTKRFFLLILARFIFRAN